VPLLGLIRGDESNHKKTHTPIEQHKAYPHTTAQQDQAI
jgi:hypothetical protein